jgi:MFS family permease
MMDQPPHWPAWSVLRAKRGFQLLLLSLATASAFLARTSLGPLQETMRVALALSDSQMALLQGPPLALGIIATVPLGILIDRRSRVRLIWIFALLGLLASGLSAAASSVTVLFTARCLTGLSAAAVFNTVLSLLADWYPSDQRGRATMAVSFGGAVGLSGAFALGGFLLALIGPGANSWRWAMMGLALPMIACLLCIGAMQEPARTGSIVKNLAPRNVYVTLWRYRATMLPLIVGFALVAGIADGAALIWAAPALTRAFHLTPDRVSAIMAFVLLTNARGRIGGSWPAQRWTVSNCGHTFWTVVSRCSKRTLCFSPRGRTSHCRASRVPGQWQLVPSGGHRAHHDYLP